MILRVMPPLSKYIPEKEKQGSSWQESSISCFWMLVHFQAASRYGAKICGCGSIHVDRFIPMYSGSVCGIHWYIVTTTKYKKSIKLICA